MRRGATVVTVLCLGALASLGQVRAAGAENAFYEQLMESGILAAARGDYSAAAKDLRLACFGLLDEPPRLAECLTYLAVAQAETADVPAFLRTFDRILEVERKFQAYSQLELDPALRADLESRAESWVPYEVLERSQVFRSLGRSKRLAEILEMPLAARREMLGRRLAAEPDDPTWRLLAAEIDLETGDFQAAWEAAESLRDRVPPERLACLRGRAGAAIGRCEMALPDLELCQEPAARREVMERRLRCTIQLADWDGAELVLSQLPADERQRAPFRQLNRDVVKGRKAARGAPQGEPAVDTLASEAASGEEPANGDLAQVNAPPVTPAMESPPPTSVPPTSVPPASVPPVSVPPVEVIAAPVEELPMPDAAAAEAVALPPAEAEIERLRERSQALGSREELGEIFDQARQIADQRPLLGEAQVLAAEIAYRLSRWDDTVRYFRRAGEAGEQPEQQFYLAVALYEAGDSAAARELLERCLPSIEATPFVRSYESKILNGAD